MKKQNGSYPFAKRLNGLGGILAIHLVKKVPNLKKSSILRPSLAAPVCSDPTYMQNSCPVIPKKEKRGKITF
jgi:hypothetical protein